VLCALTASTANAFVPVRLQRGSNGQAVVVLQQYLHNSKRGNFYECACGFDGAFGPLTESGLKQWQQKVGRKTTGQVVIGSSEWNQLRTEATTFRPPSYINSGSIYYARQAGWAIDASKHPGMVSVLHYESGSGQMLITLSISASYGGYIDGAFRPTVDGVGHIYAKEGADFRSSEWHNAPMPWAAFFSGGQALHYDPLGASHGCIHIPSMSAAKYIHDLPYETAVVVHE
jgi:peptidoglycan hydrolase-like protein with peptidoglycan-binding domain